MEEKIELKIGNVIDKLKEIPDNSIDCIVTSPPYYGLRSYKGAETIWGGSPRCEHEWTEYVRKGQNGGKSSDKLNIKKSNEQNFQVFEDQRQNMCLKCGAWKGQLGLEPDYKMYLSHLLIVTSEIMRVLKPTGTLWWNMGDSYSGSNQGSGAMHKSPHGIQDVTKGYFAADTNRKTPLAHQDMPSKSLMQLPTRFAIRMVDEQGWILRNTMIWKKRNHMPSSVRDRLANSYEFIFFFTKQKHYFFNLDAVRVPNKVVGVTDMRPPNILRQKLYSNSSYNRSDDPHLAQFKIKNTNARNGDISYERKQHLIKVIYSIAKSIRGQSQYNTTATGNFLEGERYAKSNRDALNILQQQEHLTVEELDSLKDYIQNHFGNPIGKNPGDILELSTQPFKGAHFAVFPPKLPEFCIKAGCPKEGVVLDPFAGSGTTMFVAKQLGRSAIGIEISPEYAKIIKQRLDWGSGLDTQWIDDNSPVKDEAKE
jgi:DNA modification methylase